MRLIYGISFLMIGALCHSQNTILPFNDAKIRYEGRILNRSDAAELSWSGTSATIKFKGTHISAVLKDLDTANYYNVIVDNQFVSKFHIDTIKQSYLLASGLKKGRHTVQLFKRTEWDKGKTLFYGFELTQETKILAPPTPKKRKIEFYGNSITCGYAIEDNRGKDSWYGYFQNNYLTYAAITARHFDAQYHCIAKSGIGIMLSWFPLIMPEMYDRLDPTDPNSKWDFSKYTPDVVVINLFQNDSWLVNKPDRAEFKSKFGSQAPNEDYIIASYKEFVTSVRNKYPKASIICALGSMDATKVGSPWPGYIKKALEQMQDPKIYSLFFEFNKTGRHPSVADQKVMADSLIGFVEKNIKW